MTPPPGTAGFGVRLRRWWQGRDRRKLLLGSPALAGGLVALAGGAVVLAAHPRELHARYLAEGKAALKVKNYPHALTCFERLAPDPAADPDTAYRLALAAEAAGDLPRAAGLMRALAPDGAKGYAPAHYWRARHLLLAAPGSPVAADMAEAHLTRAIEGDLDDRDAVHGLLGQLSLARAGRADVGDGRDAALAAAERHLAEAVGSQPAFRVPLARVLALRGNPTRSRQEAEQAVRYFREKATAEPGNVRARLFWADAAVVLADFPAAVDALEKGHAATRSPDYPPALARVYVAWHDARKGKGAAAAELVGLLDKGLAFDPANKDLLHRLTERTRVGGADADAAREALRGLLAKGGTALAPVHFALAVDARTRGEAAAEKFHLEQALKLDPKAGLIANNLAVVLADPPAPDLPRAWELATAAVALDPNRPTYRDTRGRIALKLGKPADALPDLELVLAKAPDTPGLHAALAEAYEKLGRPELAKPHREIAAAGK